MQIITGDCLEELQSLEAESVHSCMTSPPYWNLRDYDHDDQLGLEEDSDDYVQNIADVMDEVKRVLRSDGSLWLNLGDTYHDKDLQQIPARVALELQQRGWMLRNRVTWAKPNPMPQSVKDRLNDTTEAVFHFVKNKDYWYDLDAVREEHAESSKERMQYGKSGMEGDPTTNHDDSVNANYDDDCKELYHDAGKNPGDVFEVATKPFPEAHFAVYPPELCEKPIKATVPPKVCPECGNAFEKPYFEVKDWGKVCDCELNGMASDVVDSGIILDPFAGAGTTLLKAKELGRDAIGIELNPEYADMARARIGLEPHDPANVREDDGQNGLEQY